MIGSFLGSMRARLSLSELVTLDRHISSSAHGDAPIRRRQGCNKELFPRSLEKPLVGRFSESE
jgi:hypothetical protein